jgi:hypothetical protein
MLVALPGPVASAPTCPGTRRHLEPFGTSNSAKEDHDVKHKQIVVLAVTMTVFTWSGVMVAAGQTAAATALAPALAVTVQQIVHTARTHGAPRPVEAADKEDDAP